METFELILILTSAVLLSAVLEQVVPKVSLPLIQVGIGIVIALLAQTPIAISFDPEFFLLVFIAPILFHDAKHADKLGLWRNRGYILSLVVGLVVFIMVVVGFSVNAFIPAVPLAAALALGAALGPTDAVAVLSLSKVAKIDRRESALLAGEGLLNDASGVVAFQFAIAAAATGTFAVVDASVNFVIAFFGGILLGLFAGWLSHFISERVDSLGLDTNTFHVLFDVILPFVIYITAELVHVSGIIAVVAAGLILSIWEERAIGPSKARLSIVSSNVWGVITFTLNGIVFVLLGLMLPRGMASTLSSTDISNAVLIAVVLGLTVFVVLARFVWVYIFDRISHKFDSDAHASHADHLRSALITTIGGPKGAVTLSIIMSTPFFTDSGAVFPQRSLLIFLASGVIICTLLLANFLLPVLAPADKAEEESSEDIARSCCMVLRRVIERLASASTKESRRATRSVIASYNERIERLLGEADIVESNDALRLAVLDRQQEKLFDMIDAGELDEVEGYNYLRRLSDRSSYINHKDSGIRFFLSSIQHSSSTWRYIRRWFRKQLGRIPLYDDVAERVKVQEAADMIAIEYLGELLADPKSKFPPEQVTQLLFSYQRAYRRSQGHRLSITSYTRVVDDLGDVQRNAFRYELEEIDNALENEEISRRVAKIMRDNVYLMMLDLDADFERA